MFITKILLNMLFMMMWPIYFRNPFLMSDFIFGLTASGRRHGEILKMLHTFTGTLIDARKDELVIYWYTPREKVILTCQSVPNTYMYQRLVFSLTYTTLCVNAQAIISREVFKNKTAGLVLERIVLIVYTLNWLLTIYTYAYVCL